MMKAKELKTKIYSHADSLILSHRIITQICPVHTFLCLSLSRADFLILSFLRITVALHRVHGGSKICAHSTRVSSDTGAYVSLLSRVCTDPWSAVRLARVEPRYSRRKRRTATELLRPWCATSG